MAYREPQGTAAAESPPLPSLTEGELLVVPRGTSFPKMCITCGARSGILLRSHTFTFTKQPSTGTRLLWGALLGPLGGAIATARATEHAQFSVPVCPKCDARWTNGKIASIASLGALCVVTGWLAIEYFGGADKSEMTAPLIAFLVTVVAMVAVHRGFVAGTMVRCLGIEGRYVKLGGTAREFRDAVVAGGELPRKKKKKRPVEEKVA